MSLPPTIVAAGTITDSLGREWDPLKHPRDRKGKFIHTFRLIRAFLTPDGSDAWATGEVQQINQDGSIRMKVNKVASPSNSYYVGQLVDVKGDLIENVNEKATLTNPGVPTKDVFGKWSVGGDHMKDFFERAGFSTDPDDGQSDFSKASQALESYQTGKTTGITNREKYQLALYMRWTSGEGKPNDDNDFMQALEAMDVDPDVIDDTPDGLSGVNALASLENDGKSPDPDSADSLDWFNEVVPSDSSIIRELQHRDSDVKVRFHADGTQSVVWPDGTEELHDKNKGSVFAAAHEAHTGPGTSPEEDVTDTDTDWNEDGTIGEPDEEVPAPAGPAEIVDATNWTKVGSQQGSNEGGTYQDEDGNLHYVKSSKTSHHAKNEVLAVKFYEAAGIMTAKQHLTETPFGTIGTSSPLIPGVKQDLAQHLDDTDYLEELHNGFAVDAWLANWDVVGLEYDNILTDGNGDPVRVDPGGALWYRAMGENKGGAFGDIVPELERFKTKGQASQVFKNISQDSERTSAQRVLNISPEKIDELVDSLNFGEDGDNQFTHHQSVDAEMMKATLKARRAFIADYYGLALPEASQDGHTTSLPAEEVPDEEIPVIANPSDPWSSLYTPTAPASNSSDKTVTAENFKPNDTYSIQIDVSELDIDYDETISDLFKGTTLKKVDEDKDGPDPDTGQPGYHWIIVEGTGADLEELIVGKSNLSINDFYSRAEHLDANVSEDDDTPEPEPEPAAPVSTSTEPGPGSTDWANMKDDKGEYRWTADGKKIRVGMKAVSTKDGLTGTIHKFEKNHDGVVVLGDDGKKRGRKIKTLKVDDAEDPTMAPAGVEDAPIAEWEKELLGLPPYDTDADTVPSVSAPPEPEVEPTPDEGFPPSNAEQVQALVDELVSDYSSEYSDWAGDTIDSAIKEIHNQYLNGEIDKNKASAEVSDIRNEFIGKNGGDEYDDLITLLGNLGDEYYNAPTPPVAPEPDATPEETPSSSTMKLADMSSIRAEIPNTLYGVREKFDTGAYATKQLRNAGYAMDDLMAAEPQSADWNKSYDRVIYLLDEAGEPANDLLARVQLWHSDVTGQNDEPSYDFMPGTSIQFAGSEWKKDADGSWVLQGGTGTKVGKELSLPLWTSIQNAAKGFYGDPEDGSAPEGSSAGLTQHELPAGYAPLPLGHTPVYELDNPSLGKVIAVLGTDGKYTAYYEDGSTWKDPLFATEKFEVSADWKPYKPYTPEEPASTPAPAPTPVVKTGPSMPGADGKPIYIGDQVKSTSDSEIYTVVKFEANGTGVVVQSADGKKKARKASKLKSMTPVQPIAVDKSHPMYGKPQPVPPPAPDVQQPSQWVEDSWIESVKSSYKASTGKELEQSKNWHRYQSVIENGDKTQLDYLKNKNFITSEQHQEALDYIEFNLSEQEAQLNAHKELKLAYAKELGEWAYANGYMDSDHPGLYQLKGVNAGEKTFSSNQEGHQWGKKIWSEYNDTVPSNIKSSVESYTGSGYEQINGGLQQKKEKSLLPGNVSSSVKNIDKYLEKAPRVPEDVTVVRGNGFTGWIDPVTKQSVGTLSYTERERAMHDIKGTVQVNWGFQSATPGNIPGYSTGKPVWMYIRVPEGAKAAYVSAGASAQGEGEYEILLDRGWRMYVHNSYYGVPTGASGWGQKWIVEVEMVPPGWTPPNTPGDPDVFDATGDVYHPGGDGAPDVMPLPAPNTVPSDEPNFEFD